MLLEQKNLARRRLGEGWAGFQGAEVQKDVNYPGEKKVRVHLIAWP